MEKTDKQDYVLSAVGVIFALVGASKWLYDLLILDSIKYWKIYLVMMILGAFLMGFVKIEKALTKVVGRV